MTLVPTAKLSMEMTRVLAEMECAGIAIDPGILAEIKHDYEVEFNALEKDLNDMIREVMGDTPINLDAAEDRSILFYSRRLNDKKAWQARFNIGSEVKGATRKKKVRPQVSANAFKKIVSTMTTVVKRTEAECCYVCEGTGKVGYLKKDGTMSKPTRNCKRCNKGIFYRETGKVAGLKIMPRIAADAAYSGFSVEAAALERALPYLKGVALEFVTKYMRYTSIKIYLRTFVGGIEAYKGKDNMLHFSLNQTITATGRLSSSRPNFQNMPRGTTFPVKRCVVSRFEGGKICEVDFAQLEFRVAGCLARDEKVYEDVHNDVDVHKFTASVLNPNTEITKELRQGAKADTFKPLYGGTSGTERQKAYYAEFKRKYAGVAAWHEELMESALIYRKVTLPSGREYHFPDTKRTRWGGVTGATSIKNYPVQGFATGDLLPIALVYASKLFKQHGVQSILVNTVHDSIVVDVYPGEEDLIVQLLTEACMSLKDECERRYDYNYDMPIGIEISMGENWLEQSEVYVN